MVAADPSIVFLCYPAQRCFAVQFPVGKRWHAGQHVLADTRLRNSQLAGQCRLRSNGHGAARARDLIADGYAGEREPGDPLRYALKPDGSTEWYRLDRNGNRIVVRRETQWQRLGFASAEAWEQWLRRRP